MEDFVNKQLYGGAITASIPSRFSDVSDFRQVPDHQEVFADANTDQSIIIELNSMVPGTDDEAISVHFDQLCDDNEATSSKILHQEVLKPEDMPQIPADAKKILLLTQQQVSKFKESAQNLVNLYILIVRLPSVQTDLLILFNDLVAVAPNSSSKPDSVTGNIEGVQHNVSLFRQVIKTLKINDWSLFG